VCEVSESLGDEYMSAALSSEQRQFKEATARFFSGVSPTTVVRDYMSGETGFDALVWRRLAEELGLTGIHIPEVYGGAGFGPVELGIACEEMGRTLYTGPFLSSSVMAGCAVLRLGNDDAKARYLPGLASGEIIGALLLDSLDAERAWGRVVKADEMQRLHGDVPIALGVGDASVIFALAESREGLALYRLLDPPSKLVTHERSALDPTRRIYQVRLNAAPAERIGLCHRTASAELFNDFCVALAHEQIGGASALFESTVAYTKMRYQFGRPIGSFQALKHRCADLLLDLELAKSATYEAATVLARGENGVEMASMAKAMASDVYMSVAKAAIQLRGGIGFTWEDDTHLWFKRAKSSEVLFGSPSYHRERMMVYLEDVA